MAPWPLPCIIVNANEWGQPRLVPRPLARLYHGFSTTETYLGVAWELDWEWPGNETGVVWE